MVRTEPAERCRLELVQFDQSADLVDFVVVVPEKVAAEHLYKELNMCE